MTFEVPSSKHGQGMWLKQYLKTKYYDDTPYISWHKIQIQEFMFGLESEAVHKWLCCA